ncbi:MAG: hypothetical protein GXO32_02265 [Crenarchaeota archaeon]|nr:hypothetical protein [Thermoproteota archaeon]
MGYLGTYRVKRMLQKILTEYGPSLGISYALLYKPYRSSNHVLILKFLESVPRDHAFEIRLDFATLLPPMRLDIYDARDVPRDLLKHIFKHGEILYIGNYDEYIKDLESSFISREQNVSGWRETELLNYV